MDIVVEKLPKSEVKLIVTVDDETMTQCRTHAAAEISKKRTIPGFRAGQAPAFVVEQEIGKDIFFQEVLRIALPLTYLRVVKEKNLPVVSRPKVKVLSENPLKYEAISALMPEVKLKKYKNVSVAKQEPTLGANDVDEVIEEMRKYRGKTDKKTGGIVEKGDKVEIDFEGFDEKGVSLENTKSSNHPLVVGENTLIPGFEDNLIGMKEGDEKEFTVRFPKDYHHKPFQNKKVTFKVKMNALFTVDLPNLDETFVESVLGEKKSVDEFKAMITEDLRRRKESEIRAKRENELLEKWLSGASVEVPPSLTEEEIDYLMEQMKRDVEGKGIPWSAYEEHMKKKGKDTRKDLEEEANKRIKIRLIVQKILEEEKIDVPDEDVEKEVVAIASRYPESEIGKVKKTYTKDAERFVELKNRMRLNKLMDQFL